MKRLTSLLLILLPLWVSAQTIFIKGLYNQDKTIKVLYSNNTYDYIVKANVGRIIFFGSSPTALNIEMVRYGGGTNDATYRINTTQMIAPITPNARVLADTLNNWLQTSFGSLGGTVDSIYFRGDTLFYNVIGVGELSAGIADTVIAGIQSLSVSGNDLSISGANTVTVPNIASTNLTFTADRVHNLDTFGVTLRRVGVHSLQVGADVPTGMLPLPDLKFSGFTGSNASAGKMALNGEILDPSGAFGDSNVYVPLLAYINGDPFSASGTLSSYSTTNVNGNAGTVEQYFDGNDLLIIAFDSGDKYLVNFTTSLIKWQLGKDGSITHDGAYANNGYVNYTAGGNDTIPDNVSYYVYNPATSQSNATITLPPNPVDGQILYIFGGGTVTNGNVITSFTLNGNGSTVIGDGANQLKVGKALELHYMNNIWYAVSH